MTDPSGPQYPKPPGPGSNALGTWNVGVSQIGDIKLLRAFDVITSQFGNSPIMDKLMVSTNEAIDQTLNFDAFFDAVVNVDTASGWGLDIWGRIVGIQRTVSVPSVAPPTPYFGWTQAKQPGWSQGAPWYSGEGAAAPIINSYVLSDSQFRRLIYAKALANISNGSIQSINKCLFTLFQGRGRCWVSLLASTQTYFGWTQAQAPGFNQGSPFYSGALPATTLGLQFNFTFPLTATDYGMMLSGVMPVPPHIPTAIVFVSA